MNSHANGKGRQEEEEFFFQPSWPKISLRARQLASLSARVLLSAIPAARAIANPLTAQLLHPLIVRGEQKTRQREAEFFSWGSREIAVANTGVAHAAALTEVLAAQASRAGQESEAAALIGTGIPLSLRIMGGQGLPTSVLSLLLVASARLVRFLHRYSPTSRRLLSLIPTILRRTVASLLVARQWGCPMTSALVGGVMTAQTKRVLRDAPLVTQSIIRNAAIRASTVVASAVRNGGLPAPVPLRDRRFQQFTRRDRTMTLFEAPVSYTNPEMEDPWAATESGYPYTNPEYEEEWEYPEMTQYSNPEYEYETDGEYPEMTPYSNPEYEYEGDGEYPEMTPYSNPEYEYEGEGEYPEMTPYSNPEWEDEGEYFFGGLKRLAKRAVKGIKKVARGAAKLAKRIAPSVVGKLATMIPGVGVVAGPLAAKLTRAFVQEGEMEAAQMEAQLFGSNPAEAEVADSEIAEEAALTEFLAAQAAEAGMDAEAEANIGSTLPITITIMGGRKALKRVTPILAQANAKLAGTLRRQGPLGKQLLRTVPSIQRRAVATLKAASRSGKPITGPLAAKAMAAATQQVLSNPATVERAIVRNAALRQRTAPPNPRRSATSGCPTCKPSMARR